MQNGQLYHVIIIGLRLTIQMKTVCTIVDVKKNRKKRDFLEILILQFKWIEIIRGHAMC